MAEYVTLAVLRAYREMDAYAAQQRDGRWQPRPRLAKAGFGVGLMGFGVLGQAIAAALAPVRLSARPAGAARASRCKAWRASPGPTSCRRFSRWRSVLVCTLPSTPETDGHSRSRHAVAASAGRARRQHRARRARRRRGSDRAPRLRATSPARRSTCSRTEPLPADHPFWHHPRVTVTPHVSAATLIPGFGRAGRGQDPPPRARDGGERRSRSAARILKDRIGANEQRR